MSNSPTVSLKKPQQERILNITSFLARYGLGIIPRLIERLSLDTREPSGGGALRSRHHLLSPPNGGSGVVGYRVGQENSRMRGHDVHFISDALPKRRIRHGSH
jgi:hypothetical protein